MEKDGKEQLSAKSELPPNFVEEKVKRDLLEGKHEGRLATRFPPEPNGYLHIGHAKSICLNFGLAKQFSGTCNLRFDDTNPETEEVEFVEAIKQDVRWLGFEWSNDVYYASDYFEQLFQFALHMVKEGKAYVDSRSLEEIRQTRGDFHTVGQESPFRGRSVEENLDLFMRMRRGEFEEGAHVLRGKGDMSSPDVKMRDPLMYRIRHVRHHRTKDAWCIYPMYDWAHGQCDFIEKITHSVCTLEFINHRPLYHWFLDQIGAHPIHRPEQIEFAKLGITYTVLSKRRLLELVEKKYVTSWDDPRMPTLSGLRRRGYTPEAIRNFCERIGVATRDSLVDVALLEHELREDLNVRAERALAVLDPLKVTIENLDSDEPISFDVPLYPQRPESEMRKVLFSRNLYIERDDFSEHPPKDFFRLAPGREVRLRYTCIIKCEKVIKDETGKVVELICSWDPSSKGGAPKDGRKVKGTIHWVSADHCATAEVRLYDRLFSHENPMSDKENWLSYINPKSNEIRVNCKLEANLKSAKPGVRFQFERLGYFVVDKDSSPEKLVFNRTIGLKDSWARGSSR